MVEPCRCQVAYILIFFFFFFSELESTFPETSCIHESTFEAYFMLNVKMTTPIPTVQIAAVIQEPGPNGTVRIDNAYPVETPSKHQVLVKLTYSGVW
jgi:hypothetical protein